MDLLSLSFEEVNHLWGFLGTRQSPSAIFRGRLVVVSDQRPWHATLKADLGLDYAEIQQGFFRGEWQEVVRGRKVEQIRSQLKAMNQEFEVRITLIAPDGTVILESDRDDLENIENHGHRPEVEAARKARILSARWRPAGFARPAGVPADGPP